MFRSKRVKPEPGRDMNVSLQVKTGRMHNLSAFDPDLQNRDHVELIDWLASFRRLLPSIRRILLSLVDDHVKHGSEHVKLRLDHVKH